MKIRKKFSLIVLSIISCLHVSAAEFNQCLEYFPDGKIPKIEERRALQRLRDLCFDSFAVMHSGESKTPVYTVEKINRERIENARKQKRTDRFYPEARLPMADRAQLEDYKNKTENKKNYDKGHMAPAGDMPSPNAMAQSFSLANMIPQPPRNNRITWNNAVEDPVRKYAMRTTGDLFVFTGPIFKNGSANAIGPGKVWVPTHLYKLVYDQSKGKAFAYWLENQNDARMSAPISYQELVNRTGIEFLPGIALNGGQAEDIIQPVNKTSPNNPAADGTCHTGPRGGTYTITPSGKKNYKGC